MACPQVKVNLKVNKLIDEQLLCRMFIHADCPQITTPPVPADCYLSESKLDANGCPLAPEMKCWQGEGGTVTFVVHKNVQRCPK